MAGDRVARVCYKRDACFSGSCLRETFMATPPFRSNPPAFNVPPVTLWSSAVMLVIYLIVNIATGAVAE